jgi:hypothetical protein
MKHILWNIALSALFSVSLIGCTYDTYNTVEEGDDMSLNQSASGKLIPKGSNQVNFQPNISKQASYTLKFGINGPDEHLTPGIRRTIANIDWSLDGVWLHRTIDVVNGQTISSQCDGVAVKVTDTSLGTALGEYEVTMAIAEGTRPTVQQPPFLTGLGDSQGSGVFPPGANFLAVPVPQNAGVISVYTTVAAGIVGTVLDPKDVEVSQNSGIGQVKAYSPLIITGWVPISSGVTTVFIFTSAAAPGTIWSVLYGIDG